MTKDQIKLILAYVETSQCRPPLEDPLHIQYVQSLSLLRDALLATASDYIPGDTSSSEPDMNLWCGLFKNRS